jgi:hypothetical protein
MSSKVVKFVKSIKSAVPAPKPLHPAYTANMSAELRRMHDLAPKTFDDAHHFEVESRAAFGSLVLETVTAEIARIAASNPMLARGIGLQCAKFFDCDTSLAAQVREDLLHDGPHGQHEYELKTNAELAEMYAERPAKVAKRRKAA